MGLGRAGLEIGEPVANTDGGGHSAEDTVYLNDGRMDSRVYRQSRIKGSS